MLWLTGGHLVAGRRHLAACVERQRQSVSSSEGVRSSAVVKLTFGSRAWLLRAKFAGEGSSPVRMRWRAFH